MSKKREFSSDDLKNLDLIDRYDDPIMGYRSITWKKFALLYVIVIGIIGFIIWANFAKVSELTRAEARIVPSNMVQQIQNLEGGIIEAFSVVEGAEVHKGDVIVRMSNIAEIGELQANMARLYALTAEIARLEAELEDRDIVFSQNLQENAPEIIALEQAAYDANRKQIVSQIEILNRQLEQSMQQVNVIEQQIDGVRRLYAISREELDVIKPLAASGTVSRVEFLQTQSRVEAQRAELNSLQADKLKAQQAIAESRERIKDQRNSYEAAVQQELIERTNEQRALSETLRAFEDRSERRLIRSPIDGIVKDIKVSTVGGVVQPGETIAEIVPTNDQLIIRAQVRPSDIAFIHAGQKAVIKLTAYDYTIYGTIDATVQSIGPDAIDAEDGLSFYRVSLVSEQTELYHRGEVLPIIPGMVAQVDIMTGQKTVMNYLLKPFKKTLGNALNER